MEVYVMDRIEWNDSYLLGIPEIDNQHRKLLKIANNLYEILEDESNSYRLTMSKVLKELTDYTEYHFSFEETFMRKYNYAEADAHKAAHDGFIAEVNGQIRNLSAENRAAVLSFYKYIVSWILVHIAKADRSWADCVKPQL